ncbi:hypothetical protein BGZ63DRAFT_362721 [Mariannaea sp. PMI_226]|nr:hypothetical protein BGZ63DRAFT_362721 [Mariannaea sp. PMI_226]
MDSVRSGSGIPSRPINGTRTRRLGDSTMTSNAPRPLNLNRPERKESEIPRTIPKPPTVGARSVSRVPQASTRRPSIPQPTTKPAMNRQDQTWGSSSTSSSNRALRRKKSLSSSGIASPSNESPRTSLSSSQRRSRGSIDRALGIHQDTTLMHSPTEIHIAEVVELNPAGRSSVVYPELDRYRNIRRPSNSSDINLEIPFRLATHDLPPPTPASLLLSGTSGSPSTRFSESPGPGPYSRDTTPTSIASQSPCLIASARVNQVKTRLNSPQTRPPVTRRRAGSFPNEVDVFAVDPHGLAAVRESLASSSSNSTVRASEPEKVIKANKSKRLPPPPPSPPPRKSSQKFEQVQSVTSSSPSPKAVRKPSRPLLIALSPEKSAPETRSETHLSPKGTPPSRPSRDGTHNIQSQIFVPMPVIHSNLSTQSLPTERRGTTVRSRSKLAERKETTKTEQPHPTRTPSPNVTSTFSRFAFFGRKKAPADAAPSSKKEKEKKTLRKGPTAGTGHEGYGRIGGLRRRSSSISISRASSGAQISQEALSSSDSFLAERMNPVIIAGGEIIENRNNSSELPRTESNQSLLHSKLMKPTDSLSASQSGSRNTLWPSPMSRTPHPAFGYRRPSDSSDSEGATMKPTLAFRRSVHRLRSSPDDPLRLPQPINTSGTPNSPLTSLDTTILSDESHFELQREIARDINSSHPAPKKLVKRSRSPRKWTLFGRSQTESPKRGEAVKATVKAVEKKSIAFYTMMDSSEQDDSDPMDVQEVLRRAEVYGKPPSRGAIEFLPQPTQPLAPPPLSVEKTKRSRLPQVGRIPKVVSNRPDHLSPKSFSRPFRASMQMPPQNLHDAVAAPKGPTPPKPSTPVPDLTMEGSTIGSGTNASSNRGSRSDFSPEPKRDREFLAFSPRKNSCGTIGTSSSSCSRHFSFSEATAIIPSPNDPPVEDEVWDEYNDLFGEDNVKAPASASSSKGTPFHLETYQSKLAKGKALESPTIVFDERKASTLSKATTGSSTYSADMTERIRAAFQPHASPTSSLAMPELAPVRRNRNSSIEVIGRAKLNGSRRGSRSSDRQRTSVSSTSSEDNSPLAQVNLRVGSMTVSKWLTFGHVLFSDIRHDLVPVEGSLNRQSILVMDGLGNDDWSFYAAETYPAANFYNLSPRAPLPAELGSSTSSFPLSPPNHHQIQYLSHLDKFPFAPQSFTAVVYRFPVAAPASHYRSIIAEARRVLKPNGYIEFSILDVDLNNMGNRGRRAVRRLKERINEKTPDTNLASTADLMVRLLGKAGFTAIKAARVGVPVASSVTRSGSTKAKGSEKKKREQPSLADMMKDTSPLADEGITKMVSRVGRWWYTRCYENAAENPTGESIWNDKALLSECEELGTSLKLMVCCARAPDRVISSSI